MKIVRYVIVWLAYLINTHTISLDKSKASMRSKNTKLQKNALTDIPRRKCRNMKHTRNGVFHMWAGKFKYLKFSKPNIDITDLIQRYFMNVFEFKANNIFIIKVQFTTLYSYPLKNEFSFSVHCLFALNINQTSK